MGQLKSTVKFSFIIAEIAMIMFITFVGLTKQEWMGTVFPEEIESIQSRIDKDESNKVDKIIEETNEELADNILEEEISKKESQQTVFFQGRTIKEGDIIRLYNVYFDLDQSTLKPESDKELLKMVNLLSVKPSNSAKNLIIHRDS